MPVPTYAYAPDTWLEQHPTIRVGVPNQLQPLIYQTEDGAAGLDVDLLKQFTATMDVELVWTPCGQWQECLDAISNKEIDILTSVSYSVERNQSMDFTQSYWSMPWAALTLDSTMRSGSSVRISELHGQRVAVVEGYSIESQLVDTGRIEVVSVSDIDEGIDRLRNRMVDSYVDSLPILVDELQEYPLPGSKLSVLDSTQGNALYLAVRDDWQPLVTLLNRGINSLTPQQRDALKRKWYGYELEQGWSDEELLELGMKIGSVVLLVILSFGIWNSRLRKEIKARKAAERHIRHIATHDELTGLPNRNLMQDRLEQSLRQSERTQKPFSVLFLDLDGFKQINDDFGHNYGDELLVQAAQRMKTLLRRSDTVCRHGGDEFVVILPTAIAVGSALAVARKLVVQLAKPYKVKRQQLEASVSIGVAMYPTHGTDVDTLLRSADKAMYAAKAAGKNDVRLASTDG
ncbi:hypothetical protein CEW91_08860 [Idiomarina piscisalsi]|uniref:GGDEF domain-containing protein n=1 Tax=Idiomarina piscisalsi TaxID=1096243 RepID=A0ABN5ARB2_9GAMM|nr:diguanylate cyclase [Idiomarina piscisalsi]ASG66239.1 hypothetical protein CEW91_08860 [Idiomarina piscisalsi]